jgi:two-component system chemotaxis response regulator CheB
VFIVVHVAPESPGLLGQVLGAKTRLRVISAQDGMSVENARVLFAPPDFHLLLEDGVVRVTHSARENKHRPSIDVLFRSAAAAYDGRVVGIILSGMLDDGAAGLWSIKQRGGLTVVQDPAEAEYPDLPRNAMEMAEPDFALPVREIAAKLALWVREAPEARTAEVPEQTTHEVRMAIASDSDIKELDKLGKRTPFTCPECGGVLWELSEAGPAHFRCHVGHAYSMRTFAAEQQTRVEAALWAALRTIEENERIARRLADDAAKRGNARSQRFHHESALASAGHADVLREMIAHSGSPGSGAKAQAPKPKKRT